MKGNRERDPRATPRTPYIAGGELLRPCNQAPVDVAMVDVLPYNVM